MCLSREVEVVCCRSGVGVLVVFKREDVVCSGCYGVVMVLFSRWSVDVIVKKCYILYILLYESVKLVVLF